MQIGDPKKAAVLAAVALIILTIAGFRLIPQRGPAPMVENPRADGVAQQAQVKQAVQELPSTLTSEPFARPKPVPQKTDAQNSAGDAKIGTSGRVLKGQIPRSLSEDPAGTSQGSADGNIPALPGDLIDSNGNQVDANSSENTGRDRQSVQDEPITATLNGVIRLARRTAIITVSNRTETLQCEVGDKVAGYRLTGLTDTAATLRKGNKTVMLALGKTAAL